jgi:hypothetical protein
MSLAAVVVRGLMACPVRAGSIKQSFATFTVAKKAIGVERFEPESPGSYPAVLMLHGAEGLKKN